jgi:hypothetical protein
MKEYLLAAACSGPRVSSPRHHSDGASHGPALEEDRS